jgi:hypothetical protein
MNWREDPPTQKQIDMVRKYNQRNPWEKVDTSKLKTKGDYKDTIEKLVSFLKKQQELKDKYDDRDGYHEYAYSQGLGGLMY